MCKAYFSILSTESYPPQKNGLRKCPSVLVIFDAVLGCPEGKQLFVTPRQPSM
jgi:hypothetical protein